MEALEEIRFCTRKYDVVSIAQLVGLDAPDILIRT
jgi:hypothetical protein